MKTIAETLAPNDEQTKSLPQTGIWIDEIEKVKEECRWGDDGGANIPCAEDY